MGKNFEYSGQKFLQYFVDCHYWCYLLSIFIDKLRLVCQYVGERFHCVNLIYKKSCYLSVTELFKKLHNLAKIPCKTCLLRLRDNFIKYMLFVCLFLPLGLSV